MRALLLAVATCLGILVLAHPAAGAAARDTSASASAPASSPVSLAGSASAPGITSQDPSGDPELAEIIVTARQDSLSSLRLALVDAEDRFYARWNELNKDDALDIVCRTEAPIGTRLKRRTCAPRLLDEANREQAMMMLSGNAGAGGSVRAKGTGDLRTQAAAELKRRTLPLLDTDSRLRQALLERTRLQQMYDELRRDKLEDRLFVWD